MPASPFQDDGITPEHLDRLAQGWSLLHLASRAPERVTVWDAVVLTAASAHQARLYELQVAQARRLGRIPPRTLALVVPDPAGRRVGSGGATLGALRALAAACPGRDLAGMRVLLIHAGGDSKRVPWANVIGKPFIPFPLLATDETVPTLFDHLLALAAPVPRNLPGGGLLTLTGDVLPLFDAARLAFPAAGGVVVTAPVALDVAQRHGVIGAGADGTVTALLQKASAAQLVDAGVLVAGGAALLDTGIYAFCGAAFAALAGLACAADDPLRELLADGRECSLYEEVAAALVPSQQGWLRGRPLGARLGAALGPFALRHHLASDLQFIHLGSNAEIMHHLSGGWHGRFARRVLAECGPGVAEDAVVVASHLDPAARVGAGTLVADSLLGASVRVGRRCVVSGLDAADDRLQVPDHCCLWQVPQLAAGGGPALVASVCCGVDDNPKDAAGEGTFLNRAFPDWLADHGVAAEDLWRAGEARTLWSARLFPVQPAPANLGLVAWMLAARPAGSRLAEQWRGSVRRSFAELHERMDAVALLARREGITAKLISHAIAQALDGAADHNLAGMAMQLGGEQQRERVAALAESVPVDAPPAFGQPPRSRLLQLQADLAGVANGGEAVAAACAARAFAAVQQEVAAGLALRQGEPVSGRAHGQRFSVSLPARFDIAGGWSDTPPYCLERPARVLNLAIALDGALPIGAEVETLAEPRWVLQLADGPERVVADARALVGPPDLTDPHVLLLTALGIAGCGGPGGITQGMRVRTWSRVPKGSGLGASSILAAALLTALQRAAGRAADPRTVSELVLSLEQRMTTGGGWQDQIGGLYPGVKCITSVPTHPLRIMVEQVPLIAGVRQELEERLVITFTGQERLAKNVLQIVVARYLQRDRRVLGAITRLVELAGEGQRCLALGDLDGLGRVLRETWNAHQQLDPHCSNPAVDDLIAAVADLSCGGKLAGAGGGGFMGILAKDAEAARRIAVILDAHPGVRTYRWSLVE
jgi:fucokinase